MVLMSSGVEEKKDIVNRNRTVEQILSAPKGGVLVRFVHEDIKQLISKGVVKKSDRSYDVYKAVCARIGIKPREPAVKGFTGVYKQNGLTAAEVAVILKDNPKILDEIKKVKGGK